MLLYEFHPCHNVCDRGVIANFDSFLYYDGSLLLKKCLKILNLYLNIAYFTIFRQKFRIFALKTYNQQL